MPYCLMVHTFPFIPRDQLALYYSLLCTETHINMQRRCVKGHPGVRLSTYHVVIATEERMGGGQQNLPHVRLLIHLHLGLSLCLSLFSASLILLLFLASNNHCFSEIKQKAKKKKPICAVVDFVYSDWIAECIILYNSGCCHQLSWFHKIKSPKQEPWVHQGRGLEKPS